MRVCGFLNFTRVAPGAENGLYAFARGTVLPADRNFVSVTTEAGVVYKGVFRWAKDSLDSLGVGFGYSGISDNVSTPIMWRGRKGWHQFRT